MSQVSRIILLAIFLSVTFSPKAYSNIPGSDTLQGYEISIQLKPFKSTTVFLAHYFGGQLLVDATATLDDKSGAVFKGLSKLHPGIYLVYEETNRGVIDFLIDDDQHFSVNAEFGDYYQTINFFHSAENEMLKVYKQYMAYKEADIVNYKQQLSASVSYTDSVIIIRKLVEIDDSIQLYRENLVSKNPGTFLSTLLTALKEPVLPVRLQNPLNARDSSEAKFYTLSHFWDGVNFWDGRLLYTPFFHAKAEKYFSEIVDRKADSAIKQIDWIMGTAVASEIMTQFMLEKLLFGSMYHKLKWDDAVFIHLFEKYVSSKSYPWLQPDVRKTFTDYAYTLMANNKGTKAWEISLPGLDGNKKSLSAGKGKYTLLCFWDVTCSHCRETLPVLDSFYKASWKEKGLNLYAVSIESEGTREDWLNYIKQHHLEEWTHVYNSIADDREQAEKGKPLPLQLYNIWYFPSFFLLDEEKHFMAKKLSYPQIAELIYSILSKK